MATKKRVAMPEQAPEARIHNFDEVALGYTEENAREEAARCLQCKKPRCVLGCPVQVDIPGFIQKVAEGDLTAAQERLARTNSLPAVCGRVCPQEEQCEKTCILGVKGEPIAIGRLERYVGDYGVEQSLARAQEAIEAAETPLGKVAIVGAGPAGLACAGALAAQGVEAHIFEAFHVPGGVLSYGIPEFRLPKRIVAAEVAQLQRRGVKIECNVLVGRTVTIDELFEEGYRAVFVGSGAGLPKFMGIPGEALNGVSSANEFLTRINLMHAYREDSRTPVQKGEKVTVIGGGNVAMDAARSALRLGAKEVTIVYRRTFDELPARAEELHHAKEEGIRFELLASPVEVLGEAGKARGLRCQRYALGEPDASGRRRPVPIEGAFFEIECDQVIMAIGTSPNPLIARSTEGLDTEKWGGLIVREDTLETSREGVYAGGDAVTGAATVILAMGAGKRAAAAIVERLRKGKE